MKKSFALNQNDDIDASPTMQDIADRLKLSLATVSRALRRVRGINPETRARVLQAATQLGYRMPKSYRNEPLKASKLSQIGVLIAGDAPHSPGSYLTGMSDASMTLNAGLMVQYVRLGACGSFLQPECQPPSLRAGKLGGLIMVFRWPTDVVRKLSHQLPTVSIMHKYPGLDVDMVGIDNQDGIDQLVEHLLKMGHRNIGLFGCCSEVYWGKTRFGSFVGALNGAGIPYRPEWVVDIDFETISSYSAEWDDRWKPYCQKAEQLTRKGVTAWIGATEPAGWRLHDWLTSHNLSVPGDVSITGFHRPDTAQYSAIQLTSVTASYEAIGAAAVKRMLHRIQNPAESTRSILFPCEFFPGETTAPPRKEHR
ncbi:MAG: LacI family DNA-binding transcriptional regulator [Chthoniobacteraceae bacterium]